MQSPTIIHVERDRHYSTVYYAENGVICSLTVSNQDWQNLYHSLETDNRNALEKDWQRMIELREGEPDSGYIDLIVDKPVLAKKFKPFLGEAEIKELDYSLKQQAA